MNPRFAVPPTRHSVAGLGVLNDVTITQSSAVWELFEASPGSGPLRLYRQAMRIGRDHIASTVYTIVFAATELFDAAADHTLAADVAESDLEEPWPT